MSGGVKIGREVRFEVLISLLVRGRFSNRERGTHARTHDATSLMLKLVNSSLEVERAHFLILLRPDQPHGPQSRQPRQQRNIKRK